MWLKCKDGRLVNLDQLCSIDLHPSDIGEGDELAWEVVGFLHSPGWTMEQCRVVLHIAQGADAADGYMQALMLRLEQAGRLLQMKRG